MVVIATYNGKNFLIDLLGDIKSYNIPNNEVCIVDNNSNDLHHIEYLKTLIPKGYNILFNPKGGYAPGAFKLAFETLKSDVWFCFQDSIRIDENIFKIITPKLTNKNVYTFITFYNQDYIFVPGIYHYLFTNYGTVDYKLGLMGSMIFAKDEVVQLVKNDWAIPTYKLEDCAAEIGTGIIFERHGIEIIGMEISDERLMNYFHKGVATYPSFRKLAGGRQ